MFTRVTAIKYSFGIFDQLPLDLCLIEAFHNVVYIDINVCMYVILNVQKRSPFADKSDI